MLVTADVDVRLTPDAQAVSMGTLKAGALVPVGACQQWCQVSVSGKTGWVFYTFLSDPTASAAAR